MDEVYETRQVVAIDKVSVIIRDFPCASSLVLEVSLESVGPSLVS